MSDREKELSRKIAALPPELQDRFLDQARGAEMAIAAMQTTKEGGEKDGSPEG